MSLIQIWFCMLGLVSPVSFFVYAWDKRQAKLNGWRVPEKTLHSLDAIGGWPGGFLAQNIFRHKTRKLPFQIKFWLTVVTHVVGVCWIVPQ